MTKGLKHWPIAFGRIFDGCCCMGSNVSAAIRGIVASGTSPRARRQTIRVRVPRPVMPAAELIGDLARKFRRRGYMRSGQAAE